MNNNNDDQIDGAWKLIEVCVLVIILMVVLSLLYKLMVKWGWVLL